LSYKRRLNDKYADPRYTREIVTREFIFADCPEWAFRQWSIMSSGETMKEALDNCIERICVLMNGELKHIYCKQMNQVIEGEPETFNQIHKLALLESYNSIIVQQKNPTHKRSEYRKKELNQYE